jgi:TP901 family phage tail tape measure protein
MAFDFDKSMTMIKSLVGVAGDEVDAMGETAKQMALDTGKSATEAADALFFITSAGLRGDEAMQTLEASLKAAAVGLGETKTIADLATSAMNAYGSDTLSASAADRYISNRSS